MAHSTHSIELDAASSAVAVVPVVEMISVLILVGSGLREGRTT